MDFSLNEDQLAIQALAAQIFEDRVTDDYLAQYYGGDHVYDHDLWILLAEQGLLGIAIPEAHGGSGMGFAELCLLLQQQGRRLAPVPLLSNLVLGALPIARFGGEAQQQQWLGSVCKGELQLTAALAELGMNDAVAGAVTAQQSDSGWVLDGRLEAVPYAREASCILTPATEPDGTSSMFLVTTDTQGVDIISQKTSLGAVQGTLVLNSVAVDIQQLLGERGQGKHISNWIEQHANAAMAGIQVGTTDEALRRTAAFTGERKQFGMPIGSFQAVAMRAADAYINVENMRSTFWQAMWRLNSGLEAEAEVRAAKYWACVGGHQVVYTTQHLHGGLGVDITYPIHRYFLFAKQTEFMLGGRTTQLTKMGQYLAENNDSGPRWMIE